MIGFLKSFIQIEGKTPWMALILGILIGTIVGMLYVKVARPAYFLAPLPPLKSRTSCAMPAAKKRIAVTPPLDAYKDAMSLPQRPPVMPGRPSTYSFADDTICGVGATPDDDVEEHEDYDEEASEGYGAYEGDEAEGPLAEN